MTRRWAISLWLFGTCAVGLGHADTGQPLGSVQVLQQGKVKEAETEPRQLRANAATDYRGQQDRQKAQDIKQRAHQRPPRPVGSKAGALKPDSVVNDKTAEKNRHAYLEKQKALEKRRSERDQRLIDAGNGVQPLPFAP